MIVKRGLWILRPQSSADATARLRARVLLGALYDHRRVHLMLDDVETQGGRRFEGYAVKLQTVATTRRVHLSYPSVPAASLVL